MVCFPVGQAWVTQRVQWGPRCGAVGLGKLNWAGLTLPRKACILLAMSVDIFLIIDVNVHCHKKEKSFLGDNPIF